MQTRTEFNLHYYVGSLISEAGVLRIDSTRLVFLPTGPIERAMGAREVVIQLAHIVAFEYVAGLSKIVRIKTPQRIHKFEGAQAGEFGEVLTKLLPGKLVRRGAGVQVIGRAVAPHYSCQECAMVLSPGLRFCTFCGAKAPGVCSKCERIVDTSWVMCGYCGTKVVTPPVTQL